MKKGQKATFRKDRVIARFMRYVVPDPKTGCWIWKGAIGSHKRYGICSVAGNHMLAHRASWFLFRSEPIGDLYVCHHCDNGFCVNPGHLFLGSQSDNMLDGFSKGRIIRPKGDKSVLAKLTNGQATEIRKLNAIGLSPTELSVKFEIAKSTIYRILRNQSYKT